MSFKFRLNTKTFFKLSFIFLALCMSKVRAENIANCPTPKGANDILKCLQEKHPEVLSTNTINTISERLSSQGNAWKNPSVYFETLGGQNLGGSIYDSELRISQTIELSGQRSARRQKGSALGAIFKANSLSKLEEVTLFGVRLLFRISQLQDEFEKINESVRRFKSIKEQYQKHPRLNPEQETTLGIIQMAISEFEFKFNQSNSEKNELLTNLVATTGYSQEDIEKNLPEMKNKWAEAPKLDSNFFSSSLMKSKADIDFSKGELEEARAEAWPEFTVDLIAQNKIDGSFQYQLYGAGISLPLPLFQRNQGEKALKAAEYSKANNVHLANVKKQEGLVQNLIRTYESSVKSLINTPSNASIESKHKKAEQLFSQGLISGPLIVETHRQILEYSEIRNQEEIKALEALWGLYILQGTFLEQKI